MGQNEKPQKQCVLLLEFRYGDSLVPKFARFTNQQSDVSALGYKWQAVPEFETRVPMNIGTLGDKTLEVTLRMQSGFLTDVSSGEPHSSVRVRLMELATAVDDNSRPELSYMFVGKLSRAKRNPEGKTGSVRLTCGQPKARLAIPLGIPANHQCCWTFTERGCFKDPAGLKETGTLSAATGKQVTITGLASHAADLTGRYWHLGYVEKDGLRISIRDWQQAAATTFYLRREPPAAWIGASVKVFPGCDKTIATCRSRWSNEEHFGGFGYAIPGYHPVMENPA